MDAVGEDEKEDLELEPCWRDRMDALGQELSYQAAGGLHHFAPVELQVCNPRGTARVEFFLRMAESWTA
jgi:hypothetical protein